MSQYNYIDLTSFPGIQYYRLKQVDYDKTFDYSGTVSVYYDGGEVVKVYPNPVKGNKLNVIVTATEEHIVEINLYNLSGMKISNPDCRQTIPGKWVIDFPSSQGIYVLVINTASGIHKRRIISPLTPSFVPPK